MQWTNTPGSSNPAFAPVVPGGTPLTPTQRPLTVDITQIKDPQTQALIKGLMDQQSGYTANVAASAQAYQNAATRLQAMSADDPNYRFASQNLDSTLAAWNTAQNNASKNQDSIADTIRKAVDARALEPQWATLADKYAADAAEARQRAEAANAAAPDQRALLVAQASAAGANANLANAQAANLQATSAATVANLQASANQSNASATNLLASAGKTNVDIQKELIDLGVEPRSAEATVGTLEANRQIAERNLANMPTPEQAGRATEAAIGQAQANVAQTQANTGKSILGPTFGLQQQLDAIKQVADSMRQGNIPLGTDPSSAIQNMNDSLNRYLQATIGGTTIAAASQAAQTAQENLRQQDITQRQQEATLQGQGITAAGSAFGSTIGPLIGAVKDLPAGSTALGPAAAAMFAPFLAAMGGGLVKPPPQVAMPSLPPFMQNFLGGGGQAGGGAAPQTSAPVTINIGGGGGQAGVSPAVAPPALPMMKDIPNQSQYAQPFAQSGLAEGSSRGNLPSFLQGSQLTSGAHVDSLWANDPNLHPQGATA